MSLKEENFRLWCDFVEQNFLRTEFKSLIKNGIIQGATSNPAIFSSVFQTNERYKGLAKSYSHNTPKTAYERIAIKDIKKASKLLYSLYERNYNDGYISFEVDPKLCDDKDATIEEAKRLHSRIDCDNLMIKVPATPAGIEAMGELAALGININATLVFDEDQASKCATSLIEGLKKADKPTKAVISVFVSRFDRVCNDMCEKNNIPKDMVGIINATRCYKAINKHKNPNIRTLFASTGVKQDYLPKDYYIQKLLYPHSVNTAPLDAIYAIDLENFKQTIDIIDDKSCDEFMDRLKSAKINLDQISKDLLTDGLKSFNQSFEQMISFIDKEQNG